MHIKVNDKPCTVDEGLVVGTLLPVIGVSPTGIAIAVNGVVVPRPEWDTHLLSDGDSVVILKAFYGG